MIYISEEGLIQLAECKSLNSIRLQVSWELLDNNRGVFLLESLGAVQMYVFTEDSIFQRELIFIHLCELEYIQNTTLRDEYKKWVNEIKLITIEVG